MTSNLISIINTMRVQIISSYKVLPIRKEQNQQFASQVACFGYQESRYAQDILLDIVKKKINLQFEETWKNTVHKYAWQNCKTQRTETLLFWYLMQPEKFWVDKLIFATDLHICIFVEETNKRLHNMKEKINTAQKTLVAANFRTNSSNLKSKIKNGKGVNKWQAISW